VSDAPETPAPDASAKVVRGLRFARARRWLRRLGVVVVSIVAAALVAALAIDVGPSLRTQAESRGSALIQRPLHIGSLSVNLLRGHVTIGNLVIEGLTPADEPFFTAKKIVVVLPWWTLARREIFIESVTIDDWRAVIASYPGNRNNFIKIPGGGPRTGPKRFTTTTQLVRARNGELKLDDYAVPWGMVARNLDVTVARLNDYRGEARFRDGTVKIMEYEPMWANMAATFRIDGGKVYVDRIALESDGAMTHGTGVVDAARWPEQVYQLESRLQFQRLRELFFKSHTYTLSGEGDFKGTFHLFKGGRDLSGAFTSPMVGVNSVRFPRLAGKLHWTPDRFDVTEASTDFYGGRTRFTYSMAPINKPGVPAMLTLDGEWADVDLLQVTDFLEWRGLRLAGRSSGRNVMTWPSGKFAERHGEGLVTATPPEGARLMRRGLTDAIRVRADERGPEMGPFNQEPLVDPLPIGGTVAYTFTPEGITAGPSEVSSAETFIGFEGFTTWAGRETRMPFHVTSGDWQESDRVMAAIIKAVSGSARAVPVGGRGEFNGVMLGAFSAPRIEGRVRGERMRAWDVMWGEADAQFVVENSYVTINRARITKDRGVMDIQGLFALGYPRRDGGEELDARFEATTWPLADFRHAFILDEYPVSGTASGSFHLYDRYERPQGFARMTIAQGEAYDETYDEGSATLTFDGDGVQLDGLTILKGPGRITGAAYIAWAGTYSYNVDARDIPMSQVYLFTYPDTPVTGTLFFSSSGGGTFLSPRYEVRGRADEVTVAGVPMGQATARVTVRDDIAFIESLEMASPSIAISGVGRVAMNEESDADLLLRVSDSSLDPFIKVFQPGLAPRTTGRVGGTIRVVGELSNTPELRVLVSANLAELTFYDYVVRNDGPITVSLERELLRIDRMRLVGDGTQIDVAGDVRITDRRISLRALGDANLSILQAVLPDVASAGQAEVQADIRGTLDQPIIRGAATIANGRLRQFSLPHAIDAINGRLEFDAGGLRLDAMTGTFGGGPVRFGGRVAFNGFVPVEYGITIAGEGMRIRYPEGVRSEIDADLTLRGTIEQPLLTGAVNVRSAVYEASIDTGGTGIFGVAASGATLPAPGAAGADDTSLFANLRYDVRINAPGTLRIENRTSRIVTTADLALRGTYWVPLLFGRVDVNRGEVYFEGNRYSVTRGTVDFSNAQKIEPFFDIEAETRARAPGQIYRVLFHVSGTPERFTFDLSSDPPLNQIEILSLLFGDVKDPLNAEIAALRQPDRAEENLIAARAARLLTSPLSSEVGRVVEETLNVDTVQIIPSLGDVSTQQFARLNPSARLTLGKRISDKLFLTYSRALSVSTRDQIILLEYLQSDRFAWIISQNEDRTYAVDVRVRHTF
jgi:hypothetical protein